MGELPFVLCYACAGPQLQLAVQTPMEVRVLPGFLFNLEDATVCMLCSFNPFAFQHNPSSQPLLCFQHRVSAFVVTVNCCRIIATLNANNKVGSSRGKCTSSSILSLFDLAQVGAVLHLYEQVKKDACEITIENGFVRKDIHLPWFVSLTPPQHSFLLPFSFPFPLLIPHVSVNTVHWD